MNMSSAQIERNKTKEQLEEEKKISLSIRIKPLAIDNLSIDKLKAKATELWDQIVKLETEKYDLEERQKRQDYDVSTYHATLSSCLNYHIIYLFSLACVKYISITDHKTSVLQTVSLTFTLMLNLSFKLFWTDLKAWKTEKGNIYNILYQ